MKRPDHYSPSQFNLASDCGRKYYYNYILGIKSYAPNPYFIIGGAADKTVELVLSSNGLLSISDTFQKELNKELKRFEGQLTDDQNDIISKQAIQMEILLNNYITNYIDYIPISFQRRMMLKIKGVTSSVIGYSDIIAKRGDDILIIDIKTAKSKTEKPPASHRNQIIYYALSLIKMDNLTEIPKLELHYLIKTKEPKISILPVEVRDADLYYAISSMREHEWKINQGYYPVNRNSVWCTPQGCDFYERCHDECKIDLKNVLEQCS